MKPSNAFVGHLCVLTTVQGLERASHRLHVVHRVDGERPVPFVPLIRFFLERGAVDRLPFQRAHAASALLLLDFLAAHGEELERAGEPGFQRFVNALVCGTVDAEGNDPGGLYWPQRSVEVASGHLARLTALSDWMEQRLGHLPLNPWRTATPAERLLAMRRVEQRSQAALLNHASYRQVELERTGLVRSVAPSETGLSDESDVHALADEDFRRLVEVGLTRDPTADLDSPHRYHLRTFLIVLLLRCGGLRVSEPFHLYLGDVQADPDIPGSARVLLFHPSEGEAPHDEGGPWKNREHFLAQRWNLRPRNLEEGRFRAGWKNLALHDTRRRATRVWWYPEEWGAVFWRFYLAYLNSRPAAEHPFLFVSERRGQTGDPYTLAAFREAYEKAVLRAGLSVGKQRGTSPHGLRHAYGLSLAEDGVDPRVIQRVLHHRSVLSQEIYKRPTDAKVSQALSRFSGAMSALFPELLNGAMP